MNRFLNAPSNLALKQKMMHKANLGYQLKTDEDYLRALKQHMMQSHRKQVILLKPQAAIQ